MANTKEIQSSAPQLPSLLSDFAAPASIRADENPSMSQSELSAVFEGPEKCLEIDFAIRTGIAGGLRVITRKQWDKLLVSAKCCILDVYSNDFCDSYVLSESSLFVFEWKLIIKTCGKTTLLHLVPHLRDMCTKLGFKMEWMQFSRKNLSFPRLQEYPHKCFSAEVEYLKALLRYGEGHILGPVTSDHWYLYVAELSDVYTHEDTDFKFDMMMYDLNPECCKKFFSAKGRTSINVRKELRLQENLPKAHIHDVLFEPCGYSMNALQGPYYFTMHVTPETDFSYASFESNVQMEDYKVLMEYVLSQFQPKRFTITTFRDCDVENVGNPLLCQRYNTVCGKNYLRVTTTGTQFFECYTGGIANYRDVGKFPVGKRKRPALMLPPTNIVNETKVLSDDHPTTSDIEGKCIC